MLIELWTWWKDSVVVAMRPLRPHRSFPVIHGSGGGTILPHQFFSRYFSQLFSIFHNLSNNIYHNIYHNFSHNLSHSHNISHSIFHNLSHNISHNLSHNISHNLSHNFFFNGTLKTPQKLSSNPWFGGKENVFSQYLTGIFSEYLISS